MIRVLIESSSPVGRAGIEALLNRSGNIQVVTDDDPDVIVVEWDRSAEEMPELGPEASVVLLVSGPAESWSALDLLRAGARAVLPHDASSAQIIAAIGAVAAGLAVVIPDDLSSLGSSKPAEMIEPLTSRETEVLGMLAEGLSNKLIAHRLEISEHTVKFHVTSILSKLDAASRTEAVTLGIRRGLIML